jgi:nicotinate-nucleotide pyrophosphorylase (carboxylating)
LGLDAAAHRDWLVAALAEDVGPGDITSDAVIPAAARAAGHLLAKSRCVVAGLDLAALLVSEVDTRAIWASRVNDGDLVEPGTVLATVEASARGLLRVERTLLNVLQHLSGVATMTRRFVDAADGRIVILDTRKTLPGMRMLEKYAVRCGGGSNHRFGLYDAILIKENHIRVAGSITEAVRRARRTVGARELEGMTVEVEAQSLAEVAEAASAGVDVVMLDNLSDEEMREAVRVIAGRARIEISGGVSLERMPALATIGADFVSVGALTHSAPAADISFEIDMEPGA